MVGEEDKFSSIYVEYVLMCYFSSNDQTHNLQDGYLFSDFVVCHFPRKLLLAKTFYSNLVCPYIFGVMTLNILFMLKWFLTIIYNI